ncbi:MAG: hypothetical protein AAF770_02225 [Bacteroidota bacterium]
MRVPILFAIVIGFLNLNHVSIKSKTQHDVIIPQVPQTIAKKPSQVTTKKWVAISLLSSILVVTALILYYSLASRQGNGTTNSIEVGNDDEPLADINPDLENESQSTIIKNGELMHTKIIYSVADDKEVIITKGDKCYLYNYQKGEGVLIANNTRNMELSHNQKFLLILDGDHVLHLYDMQHRKCIRDIHTNVRQKWNFYFSPRDQYIAVTVESDQDADNSNEKELFLYSVANLIKGKREPVYKFYTYKLFSKFSEDENYIICIHQEHEDGLCTAVLYRLSHPDEAEQLFKQIGFIYSSFVNSDYLIIESHPKPGLMIYDLREKRFLEIGELNMQGIAGNNFIPDTRAIFTQDNQYFLVLQQRKDEGTRLAFYKQEDLTLFYNIIIRFTKYKICNLYDNIFIIEYNNQLDFHDLTQKRQVASCHIPDNIKFYCFISYCVPEVVFETTYAINDKNVYKVITYDIEQKRVVCSLGLPKNEEIEGLSPSEKFFSLKGDNGNLIIYQTFSSQIIFKQDNVFNYSLQSNENGEDILHIITKQGRAEQVNLSRYGSPIN